MSYRTAAATDTISSAHAAGVGAMLKIKTTDCGVQ
jgi:hypothetical protein